MQVVILAAGKGTRMMPLTADTPKPLLEVCGRPIIDHIVEALPAEITSIVLVVGYQKEQLIAHCGEVFYGRPVTYVEQTNHSGGTGEALLCAKDVVQGRFLFINGDDIYGKNGLAAIVQEQHAIFGMTSDTPERFGVLVKNEDGTLREIIEKPSVPPSNHVNIGGYVLNDTVFSYDVPLSSTGELYVTDFVTAYAKDNPVKVIDQDLWLPVGYPEHISAAEAVLCPERVDSGR